jgi:UDP-N-acetylglucosamine diphosphorylase / glucose-1-phosphate thymidylyltransferase / UDP-N-acetylgalactosamine diphosphorylase / glucosamine-1-phosphate N-acetyltransferase / galactosamine-1-phosphate N-acetyltransferase
MQAVLLAAGQSSRFYPFSSFGHKSAATLLGKPLFVHTLESVKKAGISEVVVITGGDNYIEKAVGDGSAMDLKITYVTQSDPQGMGDALLKAKDVLHESFFVLHAHHVAFHEVADQMTDMAGEEHDAVLLAREENDVERFGVLALKGDRVVGIVEKPLAGKEPSHLRVIGVYLLNQGFVAALVDEKPGHYNFESALSAYAKDHIVRYVATDKVLASLKYPWDLLLINKQLLHMTEASVAKSAQVSKDAVLTGKVIIDEDAVVMEGAVLKGPCYVGKGTKIGTNAIVRDNVSLGDGCVVGAFLEVKNAVFFNNTTTHSGFIGDSVIGSNNKIAAFFSTANVRLDRKNVRVDAVRGEVDSGLRDLGIIMGDDNKIGMRVSTMPGTVIGNNCIIGPGTTVLKNIPDNTTYYTKFREVVESRDGQVKQSDDAMTNTKKLVLFDIDYTLFDTGIFKESQLTSYNVYEEVIDMLVTVGKSARLGIFSEGELDFQKTKLLKTDIMRHFLDENIHIVASKDMMIKEVLEQYRGEDVFLIDDKLPVLQAAKEILKDIKTVWVKRGIYAENQKPIPGFSPNFEVTNLSDIATIVEEDI